jgi:tetratricopeptide (TPR) repeat protein
MAQWKLVIDEMNLQNNKSNDFLLELVNYQYGYVGWCIDKDNDEQAEAYLALAEANLEILEKASYKLSLVNAYKSAFYGFHIGLNVFKAPFVGPKSVECAELAMKLDEKNPYGYIQYGNSQFYMPSAFGGSKTVALNYFNKAKLLMELDKTEMKDDWNYLNLLTMIAKAYTELHDYNAAKACYENLFRIEPNLMWVKNELYTELLKKINKE